MEQQIEEEDPRYLDGPKLVKWLTEEEGLKPEKLTDAQRRRWRDWKSGERADVYGAVDRILTNAGISFRLIPEDCWCPNQTRYEKNRGRRLSNDEARARKQDALSMFAQGKEPSEIANELGLALDTVRRWKRAAA